ncbi:hypothetical protein K402DRAFT_389043 [Aulographum hederae CBS 113979]|uniref:C2H2-type domain-containing protein n=1 Tax=Aulographum hederae CBS 113979 TaxID=1176131 RepID=A0A6G1HFD6_9PEZI|nr:hypothetical protein K402DRAFT_389043 [Aulographum hederae CBS 113979]
MASHERDFEYMPHLVNAIRQADVVRLQDTLVSMAILSAEARRLIHAKLLADNPATAASQTKNRPIAKYEICEQCHKKYNVAGNGQKICEFHPGRLMADYGADVWADHDEDCHGIIDTDEMRRNLPQGFMWQCCRGDGKARGCKTATHMTKERPAKRFRP